MTAATVSIGQGTPGFLSRERIIAKPGFNRWLVPPAALAIHLCIGMSYGLSVFWLPLAQAIGVNKPVSCPDMTMLGSLITTTCDWRVTDLLVIFTLGIVFLGLSAAVFGGWLERAGPRKAGVVAALCWGGGFIISGIGVLIHQLWVLWLGLGIIGGIGLGLGYISPVSTLIKWFPDRRGMATGMAIMGFGGGAMIGSTLAVILMNGGDFINVGLPGWGHFQAHFDGFRSASSVGVWQSFMVMGAIYIAFMTAGAFGYRVPPEGWQPDGWTRPTNSHAMITTGNVHLEDAHKTPQFWLLWLVLCLNVSAGIGVLAMASPMLQEIFAGSLIGLPDITFGALSEAQKITIAAIAGGFVSLLSLFNSGGRFVWASLVRSHRTKAHLLHLLCARHAALWARADVCPHGIARAVRRRLLHHPVDVWRRLRHRPRLSRRHLRNEVRWRHSWALADGVVDRGRRWANGHRLHT